MEKLKACPFGDNEIGDILENLIPEIDAEMILKSYEKTALRRAVEICRRSAPENKPDLSEADRVIRLYENAAECPCDTYAQLILAALHEYKSRHTENKPLTAKELRGMVGEPVWIYRKDYPKAKGYKVMDVPGSELFFFTDKTFISPQEYGKTWLAYARKPEQEDIP